MANKSVRLCVGISSLCLLLSLSAWAGSVLYTNGPVNGNIRAWDIGSSLGFTVSDSFGLGSASTIGSISFGDVVFPGETPLTITWSISSSKLGGGTVFASGTSSLTNTLVCLSGPGCSFDVYSSLFSTNVALGAGTYWLNFSGSSTANGDVELWDENDGVGCSGVGCPSTAY